MQNPREMPSNESIGYVCGDCKMFINGKCTEEDEGGEICQRFVIGVEIIDNKKGGYKND